MALEFRDLCALRLNRSVGDSSRSILMKARKGDSERGLCRVEIRARSTRLYYMRHRNSTLQTVSG